MSKYSWIHIPTYFDVPAPKIITYIQSCTSLFYRRCDIIALKLLLKFSVYGSSIATIVQMYHLENTAVPSIQKESDCIKL